MKEIGVRELKKDASAIVRSVRENQAQYTVTLRGRPVGVLAPIEVSATRSMPSGPAAWAELERVGELVRRGWRSRKSGAQIVSDMRR